MINIDVGIKQARNFKLGTNGVRNILLRSCAVLTGLSSTRLIRGSPVTSSSPSTLGRLYDILYTRPDRRWTHLSVMRLRMTRSGTLRLITSVKGVSCWLPYSGVSFNQHATIKK